MMTLVLISILEACGTSSVTCGPGTTLEGDQCEAVVSDTAGETSACDAFSGWWHLAFTGDFTFDGNFHAVEEGSGDTVDLTGSVTSEEYVLDSFYVSVPCDSGEIRTLPAGGGSDGDGAGRGELSEGGACGTYYDLVMEGYLESGFGSGSWNLVPWAPDCTDDLDLSGDWTAEYGD